MTRTASLLILALAASGCLGATAPDAGVSSSEGASPGSAASALGLPIGRATLQVEGTIAAPSADAGPTLAACPQAEGVVARRIPSVTPGRPFALLATDENAPAQDLDIMFLRRAATCGTTPQPATPAHVSAHGDEAGFVPPDAVAAIVWLYEGADAAFRYSEFPANEPPTTTLEVVDALSFRTVRPAAFSTYHDMYEPHLAIGGSGAIYVAGHTAASDSHHSPAYVSRDDGATWDVLPDPSPLPRETTALPVVGGRVGQGNEGGIAADENDRAWLYDAAWLAGSAPLYGWCDDGARACGFDPLAFDHEALATTRCGDWDAPRFLDKPWARAGGGKLLLANVGLPIGFVDEFRASSMVGLYDPDTAERAWNVCAGVGGMPGVPALRGSDGYVAVPQVLRSADGEGWMTVHHGASVDALRDSPPIVRAHRSWQLCNLFNGYASFSAPGTFYLFTGTGPREVAVSASVDFDAFETLTFDAGGLVRYMWLEGSPAGEGALLTWGVAEACDALSPVTFYAAHAVLEAGELMLRDVTRVASDVNGTCGHYMGNDVGPDGRAYLVVHATPGGCLGPLPEFLPTIHAPWRLYVQDGGPTLT